MKRILSALALAGVLALGACASGSSTTASAIAADAQALLAAAEANGSISQSDAAIVADVITGFETVASATALSAGSGDSTTVTALKALDTAIGEAATYSTSATVTSDATEAQMLIAELLAGGATVTRAQIETAAATFLIDDLATHAAASAAPGVTTPTQRLIEDARAQIGTLG